MRRSSALSFEDMSVPMFASPVCDTCRLALGLAKLELLLAKLALRIGIGI